MIDQEIARRMDAYRGNPQALMQRYQQSQQLIDLLALQKLKSEKEAAARSLQMAAAPQGQVPTIAQQREQEVLGMTKQEVAQQIGQVAQQRAAKEREAMQRLMGGIAAAPGAENVMPPQAMAAGGIVAFQAGGAPEDRAILSDRRLVDQLIEQMTLQELQEFNRSGRRTIPERLRSFVRSTAPVPGERPPVGTMGAEIEATTPIAEQPTAEKPPVSVDYPPYPVRGPMRDSAQAPQTPPAAPAAPTPEASMMGPPRPEAPQAGIAATLPQGQDELRAALMAMLKPDVAAMMKERRDLIPGINAERLAARQAGIERLQQAYEKEFDPKQLAMQKLIAFLSAGGGRTSTAGALGAGAQGYMQASAAQRAAQRERLKEIEGMREGVRSLEEVRELEQAKAGLGALEAAQAGQRTATSGLTGITTAELQAAATRENAQATRELRAAESETRRLAAQESLASRDLTKYLELARQRETLAREYFKTMKEDPKNMKVPDATLRAAVDQLLTSFDRDLQVLGQKVGMPSTPRGPAAGASGFRIVGVK